MSANVFNIQVQIIALLVSFRAQIFHNPKNGDWNLLQMTNTLNLCAKIKDDFLADFIS